MLLIDDEADNASINISNDPEKRSQINEKITNIISYFQKSAYVGYTATPFANIFIPIDEDNLFPRDFIINIPPPSNYIGPEKVFGFELEDNEGTLPIIINIDKYDNQSDEYKSEENTLFFIKQSKQAQLPSELPSSLLLAIRCFIITCAIRRLRGQVSDHNSMLIHISRYQSWQSHIKELVENIFGYYRRGIDQNDEEILELFRRTFEEDSIDDNNIINYKSFKTITNEILNSKLSDIGPDLKVHNWSEVVSFLNDAASRIQIREIHGGFKRCIRL